MPAHKQIGFTFIELLVAMTVLALLLGVIIQSFDGMLSRQRLSAAAENMFDTLMVARSESINRNTDIFIGVTDGSTWCYGMDDTAVCDCGTSNDCQVDSNEHVYSSADYKDITLASSFTQASDKYFVFNPRRGMPEDASGTLRNGSVTFTNSNADELTVEVSAVGRMKLCSDSGFKGYAAC
jgi:prepilin-type N-terminal cleavage/methylation domain-containing protein